MHKLFYGDKEVKVNLIIEVILGCGRKRYLID